MGLSCARCGLELPGEEEVDGEQFYSDGQEIICEECGTTNYIGIDDYECYEDSDIATAYVSRYTCKHGVDEEDQCPECNDEDEKEYKRLGIR
jgi:hypothetical protein